MKRQYLIFLLTILFLSCNTEQEVMYVSSLNGINVRGDKDIGSIIIRSIPFNTKIQILKRDSKEVTIGDQSGYWFFIGEKNQNTWAYQGWVFSAFLTKKTNSKIMIEKNQLTSLQKKYRLFSDLYNSYLKEHKGYGIIEGSVGFPSEGFPGGLEIVAEELASGKIHSKTGLLYDEKYRYGAGFKMKLPVGIYLIKSKYVVEGQVNLPTVYAYSDRNSQSPLVFVRNGHHHKGINLTHDGK